jgi:transcriptional regulator with XRE-family HTH domain
MRHKDMAKHFALALKERRAEKGISQELLAEKADCDVTMISLIERKIRNPTLNLADSLARGLGCSLSELIADAEQFRKKQRGKT